MIATTRMFGEPVNNINDIKEAIATYTSRAAEKLRRQQSAANIVSVFIVAKEQDHNIDFQPWHQYWQSYNLARRYFYYQ